MKRDHRETAWLILATLAVMLVLMPMLAGFLSRWLP
jgi:hypothetical protein